MHNGPLATDNSQPTPDTIETARVLEYSISMKTTGYTYWQDGDAWLGYLDEYPDYLTQGTSLEDLKEHLLDLYNELSSGAIPSVRHHARLQLT